MSKTLYADERRKCKRVQAQQHDRALADLLIKEYLSFEQLHNVQDEHSLTEIFARVEKEFEKKKYSFAVKKYFYQHARKHLVKFNRDQQAELPLPTQHLMTVQRSPLIFNQDWLQDAKYSHEIKEKLWRYWHTTDRFSDDEVIGNLLICSILYGGISTVVTLDEILQQLKNGIDIYHVKQLNLPLIFLSVTSPAYGDIYDPACPLKKSRNFLPDRLTQLWLTRFKTQSIEIHLSSFEYVRLVFKKMEITLSPNAFEHLLKSASTGFMQLDNVDLSPALTSCISEQIQTCGLSLSVLQRYLSPQLYAFNPKHSAQDVKQQTVMSPQNDVTQDYTASLLAFHKQLLKCFKHKKATPHHLIQYLLDHLTTLSESAKRIGLWLISLFKPTIDELQQLAKFYQLDLSKWKRFISSQQKLRHSSIYSYYTKLAESWLLHSQDYLEEGNLNDHLNDIYQRMLAEVEKSKGQKLDLLKRFHRFQHVLFEAEEFPLNEEAYQLVSPKAEIISHQTFSHLINSVARYQHPSYNVHDLEMLKIIYTLAFRTGMRINEIIGLRIKDIEGPQATSIWIRPYRQKDEHHLLKTDSAERNLNLKFLLSDTEYQSFKQYCLNRRLSGQPNCYLFTLWNSEQRLKPYHITTPFNAILDQVLPQHRYSFHSFRHTAVNHLAMILNTDFKLVQALTDYDEAHYQKIRTHLLRSSTPQDAFYLLAHLIGHIDPTETFRSYLHLSYIMAGYEILKYDPIIERKVVAKICPQLVLHQARAYQHRLSYYEQTMLQLLETTPFTIQQTPNPLTPSKPKSTKQHLESFIAGTANSGYRYTLVITVLKKLDLGYEVDTLAQQYNLPLLLVQQWQTHINLIKQIKNRKKVARFVINPAQSSRILPHVESTEDKRILEYFFKQLNAYQSTHSDLIQASKVFEAHGNVSHPGLNLSAQDLNSARDFLKITYPLFPHKNWHIAVADTLEISSIQNSLNYPKIRYTTNPNLKNAIRLELCNQQGKSLAAFKYCMLLLMILLEPQKPSDQKSKRSPTKV